MRTCDLNISLLRSFAAVAEHKHFGAAADQIFRSQAAVSQQMQRLETLVGCALFARVGRNKRLTNEGVRLLKYAKRILSLNDDALRAVALTVFEHPVKLGACADGVDSVLPEYLALCAETYPNLRIDIKIGRSRWLATELKRGDIDLALDIGSHEGLQSVVLRKSPMVWIAGARFHYQQKHPLPLVLIEPECIFHRAAVAALEQEGRPWREAFPTTTLAGVRAALRAGIGITARTIEMLTPDLKVVDKEFDLPALPSVNYSLYWRDGDCSDGAKKFCELLGPR